ncbi:hypothetical protein ABZP36_026624 [Zizania latifolia]
MECNIVAAILCPLLLMSRLSYEQFAAFPWQDQGAECSQANPIERLGIASEFGDPFGTSESAITDGLTDVRITVVQEILQEADEIFGSENKEGSGN